MEPVRRRRLLPAQWRGFYHLYLTLLVGAALAWVFHKPFFLFMMLYMSWSVSILTYPVSSYKASTFGVLAMGLITYVLYRFVFPEAL